MRGRVFVKAKAGRLSRLFAARRVSTAALAIRALCHGDKLPPPVRLAGQVNLSIQLEADGSWLWWRHVRSRQGHKPKDHAGGADVLRHLRARQLFCQASA
jgi:hypothetical protein